MLRRNEGFFLLELLLSLSTWLIALGILLPYMIHITNQSLTLELEKTATHLLYDELEKMKVEGITATNKTVTRNGVTYEVKSRASGGALEVCVLFKDHKQTNFEKCKIFE
jgi:competence protein ComGE